MIRRGLVLLLGLALFGSALALITAQHRSRSLFVDVERAQQQARQLDIDFDRLKIELARLSQPAYVEVEARRLGMKPVDGSRTVFLNLPTASASAPVAPGAKK
ncbi:MAG TPA: cell division protein FtsL [Burkholderiaceae bacterium]|nr:cell division protein FtsL [Burkholderiaceae bacterium]